MKLSFRSLIAAGVALMLAAVSFAANAARPAVIGLLFHADWCASCKEIAPNLEIARREFVGQPVLFTRVDQTDDHTKRQSAMLAAQLGTADVYRGNTAKTGFVALLEAKSGKEPGRLTKTQSADEMRVAIAKALAAVAGG